MAMKFIVNGDPDFVRVELWDNSGVMQTYTLNEVHTVDISGATSLRAYAQNGATIDSIAADRFGPDANFRYAWNWSSRDDGNYYQLTLNSPAYDDDVLGTTDVETSGGTAPEPEPEPEPEEKKAIFTLSGNPDLADLKLYGSTGLLRDLPFNELIEVPESEKGAQIRIYPKAGAVLDLATSDAQGYSQESQSYIWYYTQYNDYQGMELDNDVYFNNVPSITSITGIPKPDTLSPFNLLFALGDDELNDLSQAMPRILGSDDVANNSGFLLGLLAFPFKLPADAIGDPLNIQVGTYDTGINAPTLKTDLVNIDLGTISVTGLEGSSADYEQNVFELVMPFMDATVTLTPSQAIDNDVRVSYEVDMYKGDVTANVFAGGDVPVASATGRMGRDIPIHLFTESIGEYIPNHNGVMSAFIRMTTQEVIDSQFANLIELSAPLVGTTGYVEVRGMDLEGVTESDEVMALLRSGVVIK